MTSARWTDPVDISGPWQQLCELLELDSDWLWRIELHPHPDPVAEGVRATVYVYVSDDGVPRQENGHVVMYVESIPVKTWSNRDA